MSNGDRAGSRVIRRRDVLLGGGAAMIAASAAHGREAPGAPMPRDLSPVSTIVPTRIQGDDAYPVWYRRALAPDATAARYPGFAPRVTLLGKGTVRREGAMPLPCDIVFERDVAVAMRDGTTIYTDLFRPAAPGRYPGVIAWSPYGKQVGSRSLDDVPARGGVPLARMSELQKFEGPDPALFCARGYAVLNPDPRGTCASGGNIGFGGRQTAEDGYDFIEWAARQPWCDARLAMAGNGWLAGAQWTIAAGKPPHLAAIAPWEGSDDRYPQGGIPVTEADEAVIQGLAGGQLVEDIARMAVLHPFKDAYWLNMAPRIEDIDIPAYVVASFTNMAHTQGTFDGWSRLPRRDRAWLRVHVRQEWQDFNHPFHQADLLRFLDHVVKGIDNGWPATPRVRLSLLDPGHADLHDRPEDSFPLARQRPVPLYLHADGTLAGQPAARAGRVRYDATAVDGVAFVFRFDRDTEITGYMSLRLWLEADGSDDMDIAVAVEKLDPQGKPYPTPDYMPPGTPVAASALLRVSHRELDPARSTPSRPVQHHRRALPLRPGEIVPVDVAIRPMGMFHHAGEMLRVTISPFGGGVSRRPADFGGATIPVPAGGGTFEPGARPELLTLGGSRPAYVARQACPPPPSPNRGGHIIHMGGAYDSHLLIPVIPT